MKVKARGTVYRGPIYQGITVLTIFQGFLVCGQCGGNEKTAVASGAPEKWSGT